jgi:hypothetical protein
VGGTRRSRLLVVEGTPSGDDIVYCSHTHHPWFLFLDSTSPQLVFISKTHWTFIYDISVFGIAERLHSQPRLQPFPRRCPSPVPLSSTVHEPKPSTPSTNIQPGPSPQRECGDSHKPTWHPIRLFREQCRRHISSLLPPRHAPPS